MEVQAQSESRRDRKKRAARGAIAAAARTLFAERGYDAVTVAEIAIAADVAEKTVFNHFATKEELVFADRGERLERLLAAIARRRAGTSVVAVFRAQTRALIDEVLAGDGDLAAIVGGSRALQERLASGWEDEAVALAAAIARSVAAPDGDLAPAVAARTLAWTHRAVHRAALEGLRGGDDREKLARRLRSDADRAYDLIAGGLGDYGVRTA